jgi:hypothetical protein
MHVLAKLAIASATLGLGFGVHLLGLKPATAAPTIFDFQVTWDDMPTTTSSGWFKVDLANPFTTDILDDDNPTTPSTIDPIVKRYHFLDFHYEMNGYTYGLADVGTGPHDSILSSGVFNHYFCGSAAATQVCNGNSWFQDTEFYLNRDPAGLFDNYLDSGSLYAGRTASGSFGEAWSNNGVNQAIQITLTPRVSTPEPTLMLGLAAVGASAAIAKSKRSRKA